MKLLAFLLLLLLPVTGLGENGAWLTYWDAEGALEEAERFESRLDEVICFEAYFAGDGTVILPEESEMLLSALSRPKVYLSLVNDVETEEGKIVQKSKDFLVAHLQGEAAQSAHIDEILKLVDTCHLTGLEIDYENFKKDTELWADFAAFLTRLQAILSRDGVALRVVLECGAPLYCTLPEGPEYSCMCYNLYGYHSGPGPKADLPFLTEVGNNWQQVPGEVRMAFSTGGFLWREGKVVQALREKDAVQLLADKGIRPERDADSGALAAEIPGAEGGTIWYADGETLRIWRQHLTEMGYRHFDLFRLSGNETESLKLFLNGDAGSDGGQL
ncbi:MAG: hypothetical protein IJ088_01570 [Clostridia bacterium]|nr:hypothetical protein [Clostridia bacterium]